jgi:hypothetical protein
VLSARSANHTGVRGAEEDGDRKVDMIVKMKN